MSDVDPLNPLDLLFNPHPSMPALSGHSRPSTPFSTPPSSPPSSPHLSPKRSPPPSPHPFTPPLAPECSSSPDELQLYSGNVINPIDYTTPCLPRFATPESPPSTLLAAPALPPLPSAPSSSSPAISDNLPIVLRRQPRVSLAPGESRTGPYWQIRQPTPLSRVHPLNLIPKYLQIQVFPECANPLSIGVCNGTLGLYLLVITPCT
jgi:hypothetical protein